MRHRELFTGTEGSYYRGAFKTPSVISFITIILKSITGGLFFGRRLWISLLDQHLVRRNLLVMYMSLELMLNSANLALVSFSRFNDNLNGQVMVFFIITVAAAEVAVGLALIVALYRKRQSAHVEDLTSMKL